MIEPISGSGRGIAIGCGLQTPVGDVALGGDPYWMALAAIDECVRNLVCVGVDPARIAATGLSNGGFMAYRIGCDLADRVAAIAPVAAVLHTAPGACRARTR